MTHVDFDLQLWLSSVQLVRVNDRNGPTGIASGTLIDYDGKRLLLTVEHATGDHGQWAMQVRYVPGKGTQLYALGAMHFLMKGSLDKPNAPLATVDFSYTEVPRELRAFWQEVDSLDFTVQGEALITLHTPSLTDLPVAGANYGFCGMVFPELEQHPGTTIFNGEIRVYSGLRFLRTQDDAHFFSVPFRHPGHEFFKGCSGAPVLSDDGKLIGLISGGDIATNQIRVLSLSAYKGCHRHSRQQPVTTRLTRQRCLSARHLRCPSPCFGGRHLISAPSILDGTCIEWRIALPTIRPTEIAP